MHGSGILGVASSFLLGPMAAPVKPSFSAITAHNGSSVFECWQFDTHFSPSSGGGLPGGAITQLGSIGREASYGVFPPNFDMGLHNAPRKQWVVSIRGMTLFTLPDDDTASACVSAGELNVLFAADTADISVKGHGTNFVGMTETITLFFPTKDDEEPAHKVLHSGFCTAEEVGGVRELLLSGFSQEAVGEM
ncbi:hypothetical protein GGR52DRAFT_473259 [Hypoxylon sp. FL1284]|nr:hypothetical protein GGR52DRAFT_473259 [Hypoxylon sp. FL1284]